MKYRSRDMIYREILESCNRECGSNQNRITYRAEISYGQAKDYMKSVLDKGLLEKRSKTYFLTDKGRTALEVLNRLKEAMD